MIIFFASLLLELERLNFYTWEETHNVFQIKESGVRWRFKSVEGMDDHADHYFAVYLFRNGKRVRTYRDGSIVRAFRPSVRAPFPVAAVRFHSWMGHGQDTFFLGFRNGKVIQMLKQGYRYGTPGGEVGGPVNYTRRSDLWLFDDYNWYGHYVLTDTTEPLHRLLYRIDDTGKLVFVRKWIAPVRKSLPDTVTNMRWP